MGEREESGLPAWTTRRYTAKMGAKEVIGSVRKVVGERKNAKRTNLEGGEERGNYSFLDY